MDDQHLCRCGRGCGYSCQPSFCKAFGWRCGTVSDDRHCCHRFPFSFSRAVSFTELLDGGDPWCRRVRRRLQCDVDHVQSRCGHCRAKRGQAQRVQRLYARDHLDRLDGRAGFEFRGCGPVGRRRGVQAGICCCPALAEPLVVDHTSRRGQSAANKGRLAATRSRQGALGRDFIRTPILDKEIGERDLFEPRTT